MKHLNPECPIVEIGTGNCPKCNPDKDICAKCGEEYTSSRDGYCQDCEIEEERKPFAYFDRVLSIPKFVAVKKAKSFLHVSHLRLLEKVGEMCEKIKVGEREFEAAKVLGENQFGQVDGFNQALSSLQSSLQIKDK